MSVRGILGHHFGMYVSLQKPESKIDINVLNKSDLIGGYTFIKKNI